MRGLGLAVAGALLAGAAAADEICPLLRESLDAAAERRAVGAADWAEAWQVFAEEAAAIGARIQTEATCGAEGEMAVCLWIFDASDPISGALFEALDEEITACLGADATRVRDTGVNHPDIYDAVLFEHTALRASVARKRKSALGQMRITLRVTDLR